MFSSVTWRNMSVLNKVTYYQRKIDINKENAETLICCLNKLHSLPIRVWHLEKTKIGKTINDLRKFDGDIGNLAKALVWKWKRVVIAEAAAEEKERGLGNVTVTNSDKNSPSSMRIEEEEKETMCIQEYMSASSALSNTAGNYAAGVLREICEEEYISSTENNTLKASKYDCDHCDTLPHPSAEDYNAHLYAKNVSHTLTLNQGLSPNAQKQTNSRHRQSSKLSGIHNPANNPDEADRSEQRSRENATIKLGSICAKDENNELEEEMSDFSASFAKNKHRSKRVKYESKVSESKHYHKDRGQKRKSHLSEECSVNIWKKSSSSKKTKEMKFTISEDDSIDCFSGGLEMGDAVENKTSKITTNITMENSDPETSPSYKTTNNIFDSIVIDSTKPNLSVSDIKPKHLDLEVNLESTLQGMHSNYNPLPHLALREETGALKHATTLLALSKQPRQRTKVYCGVKTRRPIPTLYDLCLHVLKEHIDALEYTGGVPYDILRPILQQATPEQLFRVEYFNPYLIEDTNELWEFHCRKEFRSGQRQPMETAREMYLRCLDEREVKFRSLTSHIQESLAKSSPVRQIKLTYVGSDAMPPRNVGRHHERCDSGSIPTSGGGKSERTESVPRPLTSTVKSSSFKSTARAKPGMTPLMRKTMKLAKICKR